MAQFDRAVPPGGEGKITIKVTLNNMNGPVKKTSTAFTNDPQNPQVKLVMQGTVKGLIEVRPGNVVSFRGMVDQMGEREVEIISLSRPFQIQRLESTLEDKISHKLETVANGKHYRLKVSNLAKQGSYSGVIKLITDLPQKPDIIVRVVGSVEGEIAVKPPTVLVGKLAAQQPVRVQTVRVIDNRNRPFHITDLSYDHELVKVTQQPLPRDQGFSLEISPILENIPSGARQQTSVGIRTDVSPTDEQEVKVLIINMQDSRTPSVLLAPDDTQKDAEDDNQGNSQIVNSPGQGNVP